jgi:predicted nucleic-acid-binding Zn-ribbon protein
MHTAMSEIQISENFFDSKDQDYVMNYCLNCSYHYGETDAQQTPPTGLVNNIPNQEKIYDLFVNRIYESIPKIRNLSLYRMYVNCFAPSENPYFHTDGESGYTFLYYPQNHWIPDDGGETQFYFDGNIYGIVPISNRMVMFDASLLHRATSFRNRHRFTVAIKYE